MSSRRPGRSRRIPKRRDGSWSPSDLGGLVLWLDNSLITEAAGVVTAWPDISGNGNHVTQANPAIQPNYVALETDFPTPQPAVKFNVASSSLVSGAVFSGIAWMAVVAVYPATTFADFDGLIEGSVSGVGQTPLRGDQTAATWRTSTGPAGTRYRDGTATDTALTTANAPHLYEMVPNSAWNPSGGGAVRLGCDDATAGREWGDSVTLVLMATAVPSAANRAALLAYCQDRGMLP